MKTYTIMLLLGTLSVSCANAKDYYCKDSHGSVYVYENKECDIAHNVTPDYQYVTVDQFNETYMALSTGQMMTAPGNRLSSMPFQGSITANNNQPTTTSDARSGSYSSASAYSNAVASQQQAQQQGQLQLNRNLGVRR